MKTIWIFLVLIGCGGTSFSAFDRPPTSDDDAGLGAAGAAAVTPENDAQPDVGVGGRVVEAGAGGAPGAGDAQPVGAGGAMAAGGAPPKREICCRFSLKDGGESIRACDVDAPWLCVGAQTFVCSQEERCAVGMVCYLAGGPYGGVAEACQ